VVGLENKMEVLKMAQEGWKNVKKENLNANGLQGISR
jgi:hypothetical protein